MQFCKYFLGIIWLMTDCFDIFMQNLHANEQPLCKSRAVGIYSVIWVTQPMKMGRLVWLSRIM